MTENVLDMEIIGKIKAVTAMVTSGRIYYPETVPHPSRKLSFFACQPFPRLIICLSGIRHVQVALDGKITHLETLKGDIIVARPFAWTQVIKDSLSEVISVVFLPNCIRLVTGVCDTGGNPKNTFHYYHTANPSSAHIQNIISALLMSKDIGNGKPLAEALLMAVAAFLETDSVMLPKVGKATVTWQLLHNYVLENFNGPITRDSLARHFHLTGGYVSALFRKQCRMSVGNYLKIIRVRAVARFLAESDLTLAEIADLCGYKYVPHMIRHFKEQMNMTPSEFRGNSIKPPRF